MELKQVEMILTTPNGLQDRATNTVIKLLLPQNVE